MKSRYISERKRMPEVTSFGYCEQRDSWEKSAESFDSFAAQPPSQVINASDRKKYGTPGHFVEKQRDEMLVSSRRQRT